MEGGGARVSNRYCGNRYEGGKNSPDGIACRYVTNGGLGDVTKGSWGAALRRFKILDHICQPRPPTASTVMSSWVHFEE